ncbi:uncharacterized protein LOC125534075 [Triticum urartu]|uniref:uncharacterized protein LOC125534075 n=1 Tax=Triticum urartu TaxID=4572 RepID=UPI0020435BE1|nr:uncharacterized protein LOC125534075 [Triticum urartu]
MYSFWNATRVEPGRKSVRMGDGSSRPLTSSFVRDVVRLGTGDREIPFPHEPSCADREILRDVCVALGLDETLDRITLRMLEDVLGSPGDLSIDFEANRQCAALALLCTACLFNPRVNRRDDPISPEVFVAMRDPSKMFEFDWCGYIKAVIMAGVAKMRQELTAGATTVHLQGFLMVPRIITFDAMAAGRGLEPGYPRITKYTAEDFNLLAGVDASGRSIGGHRLYGRAGLRAVHDGENADKSTNPGLPPRLNVGAPATVVVSDKVVSLSDLPGWQTEVVEYLSAIMHAHVCSVGEENMNLRNHVESCMTSVLAMIDNRNENNVNSVNEMLGCAISQVGDVKLRVIGGEICFVDSNVDARGTNVDHGGQDVPHDVKGKADVPYAAGPSTSRLVNPTLRKRLGTDLVGSFGAPSAVEHNVGNAFAPGGHIDMMPSARHLFGPFPSPDSLDLNRRNSLREGGSASNGLGNVARRLDLNLGNDVRDFINGTPIVGQVAPVDVDMSLTIGRSPYCKFAPPPARAKHLAWMVWCSPSAKCYRMTTDYSIANPIGVAVSEMEGKRRDERFYARATDSTFNDLSRVWFKHPHPSLLKMTGEEVIEEFCIDNTLAKKGLESILRLGICPLASGRLIIGLDWAFKFAYTNSCWRSEDVHAMFTQLPLGVACVLGLVVVYLDQGWSLYAFDILCRVLHIIDRNICKPGESKMKAKHLRNAGDLLDAFVKCGDTF